jgi:lipopolysaccharide export LptBFGC system permease protein LptF
MLRTLQFYVSRELVKTFVLTAIGLTLVFSLCGGVLNMIQAQGVTVVQVAQIFMFIVPLALTLTLPVAALFACAMVYGRLAADNEFDACRASGVNIYRLLLPALGLSVFTALFTFAFANYILPKFVGRLEALVARDIEKIVVHALQSRGFIRQGPYVLYARDAALYEDLPDRKVVQVQNGAFFEMEGEDLRATGTAEQARIDFFKPKPGQNPTISAWLFSVRRLDLKRNQFQETAEQPVAGVEVPSTTREKPKFLTLPQLITYRNDLSRVPVIREHVQSIRQLVREAAFYRWLVEKLSAGRTVRLADAATQYTVKARKAILNADDGRPELEGITVTRKTADLDRTYDAERGTIKFKNGYGRSPDLAQIVLHDKASFVDRRSPGNRVEQREIALSEAPIPAEAFAAATAISDAAILDLPQDPAQRRDLSRYYKVQASPLGFGSRIEEARERRRRDLVELGLEISGIIHSRLAFSASVLVMLVLAAALGIIFRGGQLMTAFVISFVPALLVVVMNLAGRQMAEKYPTHLIGLVTIWAAIGLVAIADGVVLTRYLKR